MASSSNHPESYTSPTLGRSRRYLHVDPGHSARCTIKRDLSGGRVIVVMGVSGTGKSTLGKALGKTLHLPFIDGDDLHPTENVAKMGRGEPLGDQDRWAWLETVRRTAVTCVMTQVRERAEGPTGKTDGGDSDSETRRVGVVVACSALKKTYRAVLRGEGAQRSDVSSLSTCFVYLKGEEAVLMARMRSRVGHFMEAGMLKSQLNTLESPKDELDVVTVEVDMSTEEQVKTVVDMLDSGHDMPAMCTMKMLWNTQIIDTCIVFSSWHIRSNVQFVLSFVAIVALGVVYEYLRLFQRDVDARINERVKKERRVVSPIGSGRSTPDRGEDAGLINGRRTRRAGLALPARYRALRATLYGVSVLLSAFLMLVFMTYNAYLIFAVVAGAALGHYFFSGSLEPDSKGVACH